LGPYKKKNPKLSIKNFKNEKITKKPKKVESSKNKSNLNFFSNSSSKFFGVSKIKSLRNNIIPFSIKKAKKESKRTRENKKNYQITNTRKGVLKPKKNIDSEPQKKAIVKLKRHISLPKKFRSKLDKPIVFNKRQKPEFKKNIKRNSEQKKKINPLKRIDKKKNYRLFNNPIKRISDKSKLLKLSVDKKKFKFSSNVMNKVPKIDKVIKIKEKMGENPKVESKEEETPRESEKKIKKSGIKSFKKMLSNFKNKKTSGYESRFSKFKK
jgi:hypothetical protein